MSTRNTDALDKAIFPGGVPSRTVVTERKIVTEVPENPLVTWDSNPIHKTFRGIEREFFPIGALASALGRKPVTIRLWEDQGRLPKSRYRTPPPHTSSLQGKKPEGRRMYTREQIETVIKAAKKSGVFDSDKANGVNWDLFRDLVLAAWKKLS